MTDLEALILLNATEGIGSVRFKKLLDVFGSALAVVQATPAQLSGCGVLTGTMVTRLAKTICSFDVGAELSSARQKGIEIIGLTDTRYPALLKEIPDPPLVLYILGEYQDADVNAVGVVGSRGASYYGLSVAREFSERLARCGLTIVSGLARGIDTASHEAVLGCGGRTIAVLGSGLARIYPPENEGLYHRVAEQGAVISEFPLQTPPLARNFPVRNRIVSGLSRGVLVVEASARSGALITARYALEQNREVFAVPGKVSSPTSCGTNSLIKQGARMVTDPEEILAELASVLTLSVDGQRPQAGTERDLRLAGTERDIALLLNDEPVNVEEICQQTGIAVTEVLTTLMGLELKGVVKKVPGQSFVRVRS